LALGKAMRRREFITLLGGAAAWVSPACAQEPRRVIGILTSFDFPNWLSEYGMPAFFQGLKDAGFVEGRNINIEIRQAADGHYDRLPSLAAELVGRNVAAIVAADLPSAFAAKAATKTIPVLHSRPPSPAWCAGWSPQSADPLRGSLQAASGRRPRVKRRPVRKCGRLAAVPDLPRCRRWQGLRISRKSAAGWYK
jgi:hypothetical protein